MTTNPLPPMLRMQSALQEFVLATSTQDQSHIRPLHRYVALRLVIEGGFFPEDITPRPPLRYERGNRLIFDAGQEARSERTVVGGIKSKNVDVVVSKPTIGPVVAISIKGTGNAFRNLTNRMEEIIGDCANLHMMYPGLIYGFLHVIKANRAGQPNISRNDVCITEEGTIVGSIKRWHTVLSELTGRSMLSDDGMRYEAVSLVLADTNESQIGNVFVPFPAADSPLLLPGFFQTLYKLYDVRFSYKLARPSVRRTEWSDDSPAFSQLSEQFGSYWSDDLGYEPRIGIM